MRQQNAQNRVVSDPVVEIEDLHVRYHNVHAVAGLNLTVRRGIVCGVVGMNGSGKSSAFKAMMGLVNHEGKIRILQQSSAQARKTSFVGYVPQSEDIDPDFPVSVEEVAMMGRYGHMNFLRIPRAQDRAAVDYALAQASLTELRKRSIGALSGGQRKRAFVARAIAQGAELLILDEPFAGVDINSQRMLIALLRELASQGKTILVSTHDLDSLPALCDEVVLIKQKNVFHGPVTEAIRPENLALAFGE